MSITLTDQDIAALLKEQKILPNNWRAGVRFLSKRGHKESHLDVTGKMGNEFRMAARQPDGSSLKERHHVKRYDRTRFQEKGI